MIGLTLVRLWRRLLWRHGALVTLCLLSFWVQMKYRVPSRIVVLLPPVIGLALLTLSLAILANILLRNAAKDNPYRRTFQVIDWGATAIVLVYVGIGGVLFLNGFLDRSRGVERVSEVVALERDEVDVGWDIGYGWADLTRWPPSGGVARVFVRDAEHDRLWRGQAVIVRVHRGAWGLEWIERIERDEEKHNRRVLAAAPTASQAWKNLVQFYLERHRWDEAMTAAREYLAHYPNDLEFALGTAAVFGQARRYAEEVALLEPFVERRPNYMVYNAVGFGLAYLGRKQEAVALLKKSIPLEPDSYWTYYHLGYVYAYAGDAAEAVEMFEKVLAMRPNFPEIQEQLRLLRPRVTSSPGAPAAR